MIVRHSTSYSRVMDVMILHRHMTSLLTTSVSTYLKSYHIAVLISKDTWNPALDDSCDYLEADVYYCVGLS